ncbi:cell volume regulation protein A [Rhodoligotrophos appendicifer]|uniref:potassium/proton antiporter n=1 Tax=Rhodoligotrophos appendicifer TaxID=987056 RepID=UPI001184C38D|nr:potassium/proton antiporter [Rhodoligotrophos appendicifer]
MAETIALATLIGSGLVVVSVLTSLVAFRVGAPLLLVFLCVGLVAGEDGLGGIEFESVETAYFVGSLALAVILFDSGMTTRLQSFRVAATPAIVLATIGVFLTALLISVPIHFLLGFPWLASILLRSIVGSTDAAAVFFLLRVGGIQIRERIRATLEIESGSNDPVAIFLTVTLVELIAAGATGLQDLSWEFLTALFSQLGLGVLFGLGFGFLIVPGLNRLRLEAGLYPIVILGLALCIFSVTALLGGSGFLAVYVAGLVMGNMELRGGLGFRRFQDGLTWLAQITMFLVLGLLATPSQFPAIAWQAVLVGLLLMFVARPIAVWLCLLPFGFHRNETTFVAWVGLRGAVSILLGILPIIGGMESGQVIFNAAFIIVLTSLLIQGWTIRPVAKWLSQVVPPPIGAIDKVELELPGNASHELLVYRIASDSPVARGERIPRWARPSLVVRDGRSMRIHEAGRSRAGDFVYIFAPSRLSSLLDRIFASQVRLTDRDQEYFGEFTINPETPLQALADAYGFEISAEQGKVLVGDFMKSRLHGFLGRGERVALGQVELIVRDVDADTGLLSIGLGLEPAQSNAPRLPVFQNFQEIKATVRAWMRRKTSDT